MARDDRPVRPPVVATLLLEWLVPREQRAEIVGDLQEEFIERGHARWWYRGQALRFSFFHLLQHLIRPTAAVAAVFVGRGHISAWQTIRGLAKSPGFSVVVVLIMALGIGLNTAIFSVLYAVLLRPFPYQEPERLVRVESINGRTGNRTQNSWPDLQDWRARNTTFAELALFLPFQTELRSDGPAASVRMAWITPELFSVLGVRASLGRTHRPEEGHVGGDVHKAIISDRLWQAGFGGASDILDRTLRLPTTTYTIVGVMPPGFRFPDTTDIWVPLASGLTVAPVLDLDQVRANRSFRVVGRLRDGVTVSQATADLERIGRRLEAEHPVVNRDMRAALVTLRDAEVGGMRPYLILLLGGVSLLLVLCCVNVAALFLARCAARTRELSIRIALGAGRALLVRQLLIETALLTGCGAVLGVAVAALSVRSLLALIPIALPFWMRIDVNPAVLAYTAGITAATALLFGVAPSLRALRPNLAAALVGRSISDGRQVQRTRSALTVAEICLATALVATAAAMIRTFVMLQHVETGFDPQGVITAQISPFRPGTSEQKQLAYAALYDTVIRELGSLPGVESAAGIDPVPFRAAGSGRQHVDVSTGSAARTLLIRLLGVSPGYFQTMRVPLFGGRDFDGGDRAASDAVVIISARAATKLFGSPADALDHSLRIDNGPGPPISRRIVGVVGDVRYAPDDDPEGVEVYFPMTQRVFGGFDFVVRAHGDHGAIAEAIRQAIARVDKDTAVIQARPLSTVLDDALWQQRLTGVLLTIFAGVSLAVAAFGLYEVMAYLVSLRRREIGVRLALGATRTNVVGLVVGHAIVLTLAGVAAGLLLTRLTGEWMRATVVGASSGDPTSAAIVGILFVIVALLASVVPVRRASHIDPVLVLRQD
jgi:putative ABC transport system permease protein